MALICLFSYHWKVFRAVRNPRGPNLILWTTVVGMLHQETQQRLGALDCFFFLKGGGGHCPVKICETRHDWESIHFLVCLSAWRGTCWHSCARIKFLRRARWNELKEKNKNAAKHVSFLYPEKISLLNIYRLFSLNVLAIIPFNLFMSPSLVLKRSL